MTHDDTAKKVAHKWLRYAEAALDQEVEPTLLSSGTYSWVNDYCDQHNISVGEINKTWIGDLAIKKVVEIIFHEPLLYPKASQYLVRRAMRK